MKRDDLIAWSVRHGVGPQALVELEALLRTSPVTSPLVVRGTVDPVHDIRMSWQDWGGLLWRNNSGVATVKEPGEPPRVVRYGLANESKRQNETIKSSDWIGICPIGRFTALEQKPVGWHLVPSDARGHAQAKFHDIVRSAGGVAGFVTCAADAARILNES
jgi:hypothetical protein